MTVLKHFQIFLTGKYIFYLQKQEEIKRRWINKNVFSTAENVMVWIVNIQDLNVNNNNLNDRIVSWCSYTPTGVWRTRPGPEVNSRLFSRCSRNSSGCSCSRVSQGDVKHDETGLTAHCTHLQSRSVLIAYQNTFKCINEAQRHDADPVTWTWASMCSRVSRLELL